MKSKNYVDQDSLRADVLAGKTLSRQNRNLLFLLGDESLQRLYQKFHPQSETEMSVLSQKATFFALCLDKKTQINLIRQQNKDFIEEMFLPEDVEAELVKLQKPELLVLYLKKFKRSTLYLKGLMCVINQTDEAFFKAFVEVVAQNVTEPGTIHWIFTRIVAAKKKHLFKIFLSVGLSPLSAYACRFIEPDHKAFLKTFIEYAKEDKNNLSPTQRAFKENLEEIYLKQSEEVLPSYFEHLRFEPDQESKFLKRYPKLVKDYANLHPLDAEGEMTFINGNCLPAIKEYLEDNDFSEETEAYLLEKRNENINRAILRIYIPKYGLQPMAYDMMQNLDDNELKELYKTTFKQTREDTNEATLTLAEDKTKELTEEDDEPLEETVLPKEPKPSLFQRIGNWFGWW